MNIKNKEKSQIIIQIKKKFNYKDLEYKNNVNNNENISKKHELKMKR